MLIIIRIFYYLSIILTKITSFPIDTTLDQGIYDLLLIEKKWYTLLKKLYFIIKVSMFPSGKERTTSPI